MKSWMFTLVATAGLSLAFAARAEEAAVADASAPAIVEAADAVVVETDERIAAEVEADAAALVESYDLVDLTTESLPPAPADVAIDQGVAAVEPVVQSGSVAVDSTGKHGNIHVVQNGDTLWAISDTYLKTPWVWPAVWKDNADIANPHLIYPGDHIWISATDMHKVTPQEAVEMVAAGQLAASERDLDEMIEIEEPAAPSEEELELAVLDEVPAAMDDVEVLAIAPPVPASALRSISIPGAENLSYITEDELNGATSIVASPSMRTWLAQGDRIVLGLGEGETEVGQQYEIFENADPVRDPRTGRTYGYHVEVLGWAEVRDIHGDSSTAEIRMSTAEIMRGARVVKRQPLPAQIALKAAPADLDGRVIYLPTNRTQASGMDYVFLDLGTVHGLEVGSEIMVYDAGSVERDVARGMNVRVPANKVGDLVVVGVQPTTAVAYVVQSHRELEIGDTVRSAARTDVAAR